MREYLTLEHMSLTSSDRRRPALLLFIAPRRLKGTKRRGEDSRRIQWIGAYPHGNVLERQSPGRAKPAASPRGCHVGDDDRDLQRILWKTNGTIQEFRLRIVKYGLASAPYLAIRTLRQFADYEGSHVPLGAEALRHDTYMNDIFSGASMADAGSVDAPVHGERVSSPEVDQQ